MILQGKMNHFDQKCLTSEVKVENFPNKILQNLINLIEETMHRIPLYIHSHGF